MPESLDTVLGRLCVVFATAGLVIFLVAAMAAYPENMWITQWIAVGGLAVALLAALIAGIAWAKSAQNREA